ncbi:DnaJ domain-containing protein [Thalassospira sp.]|uniref:DnaJ domain-containing protein n=1 Tax=Thalassospira sp. TaxID=1912094 RepID=UPI00273344E3|nr:DnaJ domain-containing protein [Thalassospira sp.]MDP2700093.1 molecular chaperone DnaJ [Thalassospira sp.]
MAWLLLGIALFVAVGFVVRWAGNAEPADVKKAGFYLVIAVFALLLGWLVLSGKLAAMIAAVFASLPFLFRALKIGLLWPLLRRMVAGTQGVGGMGQSRNGGGSGRVSEIKTAFLQMRLDHDSGQLGGFVVAGSLVGRDLDTLGIQDLQTLFVECCGATDQSHSVLETYLDRRRDCPGWRNWECVRRASGSGTSYHDQTGDDRAEAAGRFQDGTMDAVEARRILGVPETASRAEINQAYQNLIKAFHPDHGGSDYLAAKINEARSLLLKLCGD